MDLDNGYSIDPALKAHIVMVVSALGGPDLTVADKPYKLGDDALACLRDLREWLRAYDENLDRWDVARAIADTSLVSVDLLEILTQWELKCEQSKDGPGKHWDRIALACLELLVPLTWPIELSRDESNKNHFINAPHLARARLEYKRAILMHPEHRILKAVLRLALPSLKIPMFKRNPRDEGIVKLVVFFFRNLLAIDSSSAASAGYALSSFNKSEDDVSRSTTIIALKKQNVLNFLLMLGSEMGRSFIEQDSALLECLFHLLKGISPRIVYGKPDRARIGLEPTNPVISTDDINDLQPEVDTEETGVIASSSLKQLLNIEKDLQHKMKRAAPSRHSRFGTLVSVTFPDEQRLAISGASGLRSSQTTMERLDATKKWSRPQQGRRQANEKWNTPVGINNQATEILKKFAEDFLDAAFNPFSVQIRKLIDQDPDRLLQVHRVQYLYITGWFLDAFRCRLSTSQTESFDYGLVGAALNQKAFSLYIRLLYENSDVPVALESKGSGSSVIYACLLCFKEVLITIKDMEKSDSLEEKDIAENIKKRLFYEEIILNIICRISRLASQRSLSYIRACIELNHVLLRMLEKYANQHTDLWVRTRRKRPKKSKAIDTEEDDIVDDIPDEHETVEQESKRVTRERKFEFSKFESKFFNEATLDTYHAFLRYYLELTEEEIHWCLAFFYRGFIKCEAKAIFFRLDLMRIFQKLIHKVKGFPRTNRIRNEIEKFTVIYVSELHQSLQRTPSLFAELLFVKHPNDIYYYNHGHAKPEKIRNVKEYTWEFNEDDLLSSERKIAILVAALIDNGNTGAIEWLIEKLSTVHTERQAWLDSGQTTELEDVHLKYDDGTMFGSDKYYQRLVKQLGLKSTVESSIIPASMTVEQISDCLKFLKRYMFEPVQFPGGQTAADQLHKKFQKNSYEEEQENQPMSEDEGFIDDDDVDDDIGLNDSRFEALPEEERLAKALFMKQERVRKKPSRKSSKKKKDNDSSQENTRRKKPTSSKADDERLRRIKSTAFVADSDDESDEERDNAFLERQRQLRDEFILRQQNGVPSLDLNNLLSQRTPTASSDGRPSLELSDSDDDGAMVKSERRKRALKEGDSDEEDQEMTYDGPENQTDGSDGELSSPRSHVSSSINQPNSPRGQMKRSNSGKFSMDDDLSDADESEPFAIKSHDVSDDEPIARSNKKARRSLFVDSDDE